MIGPSIRTRVAAIAGGFMFVVIVALAAWGMRVDGLRADYRDMLTGVVIALEPITGKRARPDQAEQAAQIAVDHHTRHIAERDVALAKVREQSASIERLGKEGDLQRQRAEANLRLAEATIQQRDIWIKRAASAETRTERASAEIELKECNDVLDALYRDGF